jgi:hypothetical protein
VKILQIGPAANIVWTCNVRKEKKVYVLRPKVCEPFVKAA